MLRTYKLRYVNELVGVFVLITVGFIIFSVVVALRSRDWFTPTLRIRIILPEQGSMGLRAGNPVQVLGTVIGNVDAINYNADSGNMEARVSVRGNLISYLQDNSIPIIHKSFGIGEPYIEIVKNLHPDPQHPPAPLPAEGATLWYSEADTGPTDKIQEILAQVQDQAVPAMEEARAAIREYTQLAADLRNPDRPLQQTIRHLAAITDSVEKGNGLVGRLLNDPKYADQVYAMLPKVNAALDETQGILKDAHKTSANLATISTDAQTTTKKLPELLDATKSTLADVQAVMQDVRKTTAKLPEVVEGANTTVQSLPGLVLQMQETMRQTQILIEGFQKSWLVRSYIDKTGEPTGRIRPDEIGGPR